MARGKYEVDACFAPVPLRAHTDANLTDRDFRILSVFAAHDQMSAVTKRGQGAWATHRSMAAKVGGEGSNESNFSVSTGKLVQLGYLKVERQQTDRRRRVYRVVYCDEDALFWSKASSRKSGAKQLANVSLPIPDTLSQDTTEYIPITRIYPEEPEERYSSEEARSARRLGRIVSPATAGAELAKLERWLDAGEQVDRFAAYEWLGTVFNADQPETIRQWAIRLSDKIVGGMAADELVRWRETYGLAA